MLKVTLRKSGWRRRTCWGFFLWRNLVTTTVAITIARKEGHWKQPILCSFLNAYGTYLQVHWFEFSHKFFSSYAYAHHALKIKSVCSHCTAMAIFIEKSIKSERQTHFFRPVRKSPILLRLALRDWWCRKRKFSCLGPFKLLKRWSYLFELSFIPSLSNVQYYILTENKNKLRREVCKSRLWWRPLWIKKTKTL